MDQQGLPPGVKIGHLPVVQGHGELEMQVSQPASEGGKLIPRHVILSLPRAASELVQSKWQQQGMPIAAG